MNRAARISGCRSQWSGTALRRRGRRRRRDLPAGASILDLGLHPLKEPDPARAPLSAQRNRPPVAVPRLCRSTPGRITFPPGDGIPRPEPRSCPPSKAFSRQSRRVWSAITGPGGVGKTRLSLQVAADLSNLFKDGVFSVDLSAERTPAGVFEAIVRALEVPGSGSGDALETPQSPSSRYGTPSSSSTTRTGGRRCRGVCPILLQAVAYLKVIVTSREALRVRAERVFTVQPLL